ncbi:MAG: HAD family hydrolase [Candidatus Eisenbacteria bacterium]|nr:HAD family hydrolase [Candidatus Eisenbacteria bacterium]
MPARPRAAVFDLDGTIIDSLGLTFEAMREAVRPFLDHDLTDEEIYARFGPSDHEIVAGFVAPGDADRAVRRLMAAYERGVERMPLFPGIEALLDTLADQDVVLALCTGRGRPSTDLVIRSLRLDRWFEVSVTGEEGGRPKPAPDGILETLRRLELDPAEVLYTGDSVKDVDAGLAAGTPTVAARWGGVEGDEPGFARATLRAHHPRDILTWWESLG